MANIGQPYTSGNWVVKAGEEDAFVAAWTEFTEWSLANARGPKAFYLIQDAGDSSHFLSFGGWEDADAVTAWRQSPEFAERLGRCRALCEEFEARDYTLVSAPEA
jgi:heme-degrading monooxygenase HmoA